MITNADIIRHMSDITLATYGMYLREEDDYDGDIDGEWTKIGSFTVYISIFDEFSSTDAHDVFVHNLEWLKEEVSED